MSQITTIFDNNLEDASNASMSMSIIEAWERPNGNKNENTSLINPSSLLNLERDYQSIQTHAISTSNNNHVVSDDPFIKFFRDIFEHCDTYVIASLKIEADKLFNKMIDVYSPKITEVYSREKINIEEIQVLANKIVDTVMKPFLMEIYAIISRCVADKEAFNEIMNNFSNHLKVHFAIEFGLHGKKNSEINYSEDYISMMTKRWLVRKEIVKNLYAYYDGKKSSKENGKNSYLTWINELDQDLKKVGWMYDHDGKKLFLVDSEGKYQAKNNLIKDSEKKNVKYIISESVTDSETESVESISTLLKKRVSDNHDEEESQSKKTPERDGEDYNCFYDNIVWFLTITAGAFLLFYFSK